MLTKQERTEEINKLTALVNYLIQSEDWKYIYLSECAEPIRLFMWKTGIKYHRIKLYISTCLGKKFGKEFKLTQQRLKHNAEKLEARL